MSYDNDSRTKYSKSNKYHNFISPSLPPFFFHRYHSNNYCCFIFYYRFCYTFSASPSFLSFPTPHTIIHDNCMWSSLHSFLSYLSDAIEITISPLCHSLLFDSLLSEFTLFCVVSIQLIRFLHSIYIHFLSAVMTIDTPKKTLHPLIHSPFVSLSFMSVFFTILPHTLQGHSYFLISSHLVLLFSFLPLCIRSFFTWFNCSISSLVPFLSPSLGW